MKGQRALRRGRCSIAGQVVLLTSVTDARRHRFVEFEPARAACQAIHEHPSWRSTRCLAWVLMPDHWHGLVELGAGDTLAGYMNALTACVSKAVRRERIAAGPIWQRGYHDRALRSDEHLQVAARYLVHHPVRAGLVTRVGDYPYWNAIWL